MRKRIVLVLMVCAVGIPPLLATPRPPFSIHLTIPRSEMILCEPYKYTLTIHVLGDDVEALYDDDFFYAKQLHFLVNGVEVYVDRGNDEVMRIWHPWKKGTSYTLSGMLYFILPGKSGTYRLKVLIETQRFVRSSKGEPYPDVIESNEMEVHIKEPQGIDREVYTKGMHLFRIKDSDCFSVYSMEKEILTRFPTSTYAGWVLLKYPSNGFNFVILEKDPLSVISYYEQGEEALIRESARITGNTVEAEREAWVSPFEKARNYVRLAKAFIQIHPDFAYAPIISLKLGVNYILLGDYPSAYQYLHKALQSDNLYNYEYLREKLNVLLKELKKRIH